MLRSSFLRFRYVIYVLTGLCVLSFQIWWLWDGYSLRRQALLDQVSTQVTQFESVVIMQQLIPTLSVHGPDTSRIDLTSMIGKRYYSKADSQKLLAARQEIERGVASISVNIAAPVQKITLKPDSQIYYQLRSNVAALKDSLDLVVYHKVGASQSSFPHGLAELSGDNTDWIDSDLERLGSVKVHVVGMVWKVLPDMAVAILFSVCYLALFIWTILTLLRTARENQRLMESKENFTQNMTHELKLPISSLFLATEALDRFNASGDTTSARRYVATMRKSLQQLSELVDRILNNARLQQRQVRLQRTVIPLRPLLEDIAGDMEPLISQHRTRIDLSAIGVETAVYGDREQLRYVFYNLIDNAIKYGADEAAVRFTLQPEAEAYVIHIRDSGGGIADAHHERIFEPYFRVPQQDRHDVSGYGLGLSIVRQILELHAGSVRVLSSGPDGTTFEIRLPRHDA